MNPNTESQSGDSKELEEILITYLDAVDSGLGPSEQALYERFPQFANELRDYIEAEHDLLQRAGPTVAEQALLQASIDTSKIGAPTDTKSNSLGDAVADYQTLEVPSRFGRYQIEEFLGEGAMGMVYRAFDEKLARHIALKIPRRRFAAESELAMRFDREAKAAAGLQHRNICSVHDVGEVGGIQYLAMSYVEGERLSDIMNSDRRLEIPEVLDLIRKISLALQAAHDNAVVHRDLKPANVMIDGEGEPILMDFGLALQGDREDEVRVTQYGAIIGTPAYMSPEQIDGTIAEVGPASDMFSLGVIFYELLAGRLPFKGGLSTVIHQVLSVTPARPSEIAEGVHPTLDAVCMKMLSKNASDRFSSMQELAALLESFVTDRNDTAVAELRKTAAQRDVYRNRSRTWLGLTICCLALIPIGFWFSIIAFKTDFGTVEIEIPDGVEGIQVQLSRDGKPIRVLDPGAGWEFTVEEGLYEVRHTGDQDRFQIDRNSLTVTRGEVVRLRLTVKEQPKLGNLQALDKLTGLNGPVNAISLSPSRKWLIVAGIVDTSNGYIMICDSNGQPGKLISLPGRVTGERIAWFDDHRFAVGTSVGGVVVIDCNLGRIVDGVRRHGSKKLEVATVPEDKLLAIANDVGNISIIDMIRGKLLVDQFELGQRCRALEFARRPEGTKLLVCGGNGRIFVRDLGTLKQHAFRFGGTQVHDLHVLKGAASVIVAAADGTVELVDLESGQVVMKYLGHTSGVETISVSPDEKLLATGCIDGTVRLFEVETGIGLQQGVGGRGTTKQIAVDWVRGLLFAGGGSYVTASGEWKIVDDQSLLRWALPGSNMPLHTDTPAAEEPTEKPTLPRSGLALHNEPQAKTSSYEDHLDKGKRWLQELNLMQAFSEFEEASRLAPDSLIPRGYAALLAQGSHQDALAATQLDIARHLDLDSNSAESSCIVRAMLAGHPMSSGPPRWEVSVEILAANFSDDWHVQHTFGLWQLRRGEKDEASIAFDRAANAAQSHWESAATKLAQEMLGVAEGKIENWHRWPDIVPKDPPDLTGAGRQWLAVYEVQRLSADLKELDSHVARLGLKTRAFNGVNILYDSSQGVQYENAEFDINAVAISPQGARFALAPRSADALYLWEPESGLRSIATGGEIRALAFMETGERLLIGRPGGQVEVLNLRSMIPKLTLPRIGKVNGIASNPLGTRVAVAYGNSRCAVWDMTSKELSNDQFFLPGSGWQLAFSPDGEFLTVGVADQKLLVFDREFNQKASIESVSVARFTWLDKERICFGYAGHNKIAVYSLANHNTAASIEVGDGPAVAFAAVQTPTEIVVSGHSDGSVWASNLSNGEHRRVGRLPLCRFAQLGLSQDGRYLLAAGKRPKKNDGGACCAVFEMPNEFVSDPAAWIAAQQ